MDMKNFRDENILLIHSEGNLKSHTSLKIDLNWFEKQGMTTKNPPL